MYDTILHPTDGSDMAELAAERALELAERYAGEFHVIYVVEKTPADPEGTGLEEKVEQEAYEGGKIVEDLEAQAQDRNIEVQVSVKDGVPRTAIEEYADKHAIDLIVLGSTGADGAAEKMLGTVSKYVVNEAPADVLVVRPDAELA